MDITYVTEFISPIALVICLVLGYVLKTCTNNEKVHKLIPCIVAVLGIAICAWSEMAITPEIVAAGAISGLASTGLYEALKNLLNITE